MIIRKCDDYFLIKIFKDNIQNWDAFDIDSIKTVFQNIFNKLNKKYDLHGLIYAEVYVNEYYGIIIELQPIESYFDEIDIRIKMHLDTTFLVNVNSDSICEYTDIYYYKGKFYGNYVEKSDSEVFYKDTENIIEKGIKVC